MATYPIPPAVARFSRSLDECHRPDGRRPSPLNESLPDDLRYRGTRRCKAQPRFRPSLQPPRNPPTKPPSPVRIGTSTSGFSLKRNNTNAVKIATTINAEKQYARIDLPSANSLSCDFRLRSYCRSSCRAARSSTCDMCSVVILWWRGLETELISIAMNSTNFSGLFSANFLTADCTSSGRTVAEGRDSSPKDSVGDSVVRSSVTCLSPETRAA